VARFKVKRDRSANYGAICGRCVTQSITTRCADRGAFQTKVDSQNYPPDLDTLVNGVDVQSKKVKFLRRIPVDPMTGKAEWGMRSMQDDPTSDSFGGQSVSTCIRSRKAQRLTAPSTRTGRTAMRRMRRQDAGFTLMELMIVMAIIGILATLAIPSFVGAMRSARKHAA